MLISAQVGGGKSHFVKYVLYEYARIHGQRILMLIHRAACVKQFRDELVEQRKIDVIDVATYQRIEADQLWSTSEMEIDLRKYDYIVADEFHYFISDAAFNNRTDLSFEKIISMEGAIRIFMSATSVNMEKYMYDYAFPAVKQYVFPENWSRIKELGVYTDDDNLYFILNSIVKRNEKAIVFMKRAQDAYELYRKYRENAMFLCSNENRLRKYVDEEKYELMLETEQFEENLLITTRYLDAGVNLKDPKIRTIITDIVDPTTVIQCIGRKRIMDAEEFAKWKMQEENEGWSELSEDKIFVYLKAVNNNQLSGMLNKVKQSMKMASDLLIYSQEEFLQKYPRCNDKSGIIYDVASPSGDGTYEKCVNRLMYYSKEIEIKELQKMMSADSSGKYGYCKYMAEKLGKKEEEICWYNYKFSLEKYLENHVGIIMYQVKDRKELIEKMDVRKGGHLMKKRLTLNSALQEDKMPFYIREFDTVKVVDGKKIRCKSAWQVVRHDWGKNLCA